MLKNWFGGKPEEKKDQAPEQEQAQPDPTQLMAEALQKQYELQERQARKNDPELDYQLDRESITGQDIIDKFGYPTLDTEGQPTGFITKDVQEAILRPYIEENERLKQELKAVKETTDVLDFNTNERPDFERQLRENYGDLFKNLKEDVPTSELIHFMNQPALQNLLASGDPIKSRLAVKTAIEQQQQYRAVQRAATGADPVDPYEVQGTIKQEPTASDSGKPKLIVFTFKSPKYKEAGTPEEEALQERLSREMQKQSMREHETGKRDLIEACHVDELRYMRDDYPMCEIQTVPLEV
jgi:hypothetical protein